MNEETKAAFPRLLWALALSQPPWQNAFTARRGEYTARSTILLGFLSTLGLVIGAGCFYLLAMKCQLFTGQGFLTRLGAWIFFGWFGLELIRTASAAPDHLPGALWLQRSDRRSARSAAGLLGDEGQRPGQVCQGCLVAAGSRNPDMPGRRLGPDALAEAV